jgi:hypothetical protein
VDDIRAELVELAHETTAGNTPTLHRLCEKEPPSGSSQLFDITYVAPIEATPKKSAGSLYKDARK